MNLLWYTYTCANEIGLLVKEPIHILYNTMAFVEYRQMYVKSLCARESLFWLVKILYAHLIKWRVQWFYNLTLWTDTFFYI